LHPLNKFYDGCNLLIKNLIRYIHLLLIAPISKKIVCVFVLVARGGISGDRLRLWTPQYSSVGPTSKRHVGGVGAGRPAARCQCHEAACGDRNQVGVVCQ
jgi:hypothetical protein